MLREIEIVAAERVTPWQYRNLLAACAEKATVPGPLSVRISPYIKPGKALLITPSPEQRDGE